MRTQTKAEGREESRVGRHCAVEPPGFDGQPNEKGEGEASRDSITHECL